ncbi:MAG TPA: PH domain-containing protein [Gillisia sp.]|nr:PH domain-containing protein [Gillisia sp.]
MTTEAFSHPQRQSILGVVLIFLTTLYKFLRGFWVLGVYFLLSNPSSSTILYVILGIVALAVATLGYSWVYYRRFLFHIDYSREEFVLQKGVFSTEDIAISFDKIQQVYLKRSLVQRLINVYSVVIETAGSKEDEVNIKAVSRENARLLTDILLKAKKESVETLEEGEIEEGPEVVKQEPRLWTHKLDVISLLKIGISSNYGRGFALVLAFFATIYNELNSFFRDYEEEFSEYYDQVPDFTQSISLMIVLFVTLLFISILITVLEVFIKYFGLNLVQTRESLDLEMGLKTNTRVSLQPRRVQLMQVVTNPVQKAFNLYEARIALASSENVLQKKKIKIPGLGKDTVGKVKSFLYGERETSFEQTLRPHRLMLLRRIFIVFIPVGISYLILWWFPYTTREFWVAMAALYLILALPYQILRFKSLKLIFTDDFLIKKQGVWTAREEVFEVFKMQAVTVKQPFWYKRRNLYNLVFHTAGGDVTFKAVNREVLPYINYLLYKVESGNRKWM